MDVLVVEDEQLVREMVTEWLEEAGMQVGAAASGEIALVAVTTPGHRPPPPVLVTDVGLGPDGMDGITLAAELRRHWPGLGVVMMTDQEARPDRSRMFAPQDRHLVKPFAPAALVQAVRDLTAPAMASAR